MLNVLPRRALVRKDGASMNANGLQLCVANVRGDLQLLTKCNTTGAGMPEAAVIKRFYGAGATVKWGEPKPCRIAFRATPGIERSPSSISSVERLCLVIPAAV
jgi:hypothetical protein